MKKFIRQTISVILSIAVLTVPVSAVPVETVSAAEPVVVVIDPGLVFRHSFHADIVGLALCKLQPQTCSELFM